MRVGVGNQVEGLGTVAGPHLCIDAAIGCICGGLMLAAMIRKLEWCSNIECKKCQTLEVSNTQMTLAVACSDFHRRCDQSVYGSCIVNPSGTVPGLAFYLRFVPKSVRTAACARPVWSQNSFATIGQASSQR